MAKTKIQYVCQQCGQAHPKWVGQCSSCGAWNTLVEEVAEKALVNQSRARAAATVLPFSQVELTKGSKSRFSTGVGELDRVLGGEKNELGMVAGAVMLVGGEPGIGKSTLLTQVVIELLKKQAAQPNEVEERPILYVCGEESPAQISLRIKRMLSDSKQNISLEVLDNLLFAATTDVDSVVTSMREHNPQLVVVDSIQTLKTEDLSGMAGSVGQVRESTERLTEAAKELSIPLFLVGHVTKEGQIAGPKVLEHIVDTVLELNGERTTDLRLLRAIKNRFGATDEVGVLQLTEYGFISISNPSSLFLEHQNQAVAGSAAVCVLEGTRPLLLEVQALAVKSQLAMPRRVGRGVELSRLQVISAVLQKYSRMPLDSYDLFVNLAGGYTTKEPGLDLGIALAIISSLKNKPLPPKTLYIGELGLLGEIRSVSLLDKRVKEAQRQGFEHIICKDTHNSITKIVQDLKL